MKTIGKKAFYRHGIRDTIEVLMPASITSIGEDAFRDYSSLTSVEIPNSVTSIGEWTFASCICMDKEEERQPSIKNISVYDGVCTMLRKRYFKYRTIW